MARNARDYFIGKWKCSCVALMAVLSNFTAANDGNKSGMDWTSADITVICTNLLKQNVITKDGTCIRAWVHLLLPPGFRID